LARLDFGNATGNGVDLVASNGGEIVLTAVIGNPIYGTTSPPKNTQGNNYGLILG
jgi:hypothetical protein